MRQVDQAFNLRLLFCTHHGGRQISLQQRGKAPCSAAISATQKGRLAPPLGFASFLSAYFAWAMLSEEVCG
jgi:hypothetical protein